MGASLPPLYFKEGENMKQVKKFDNTGMICDSAQPTLHSVRFFPDSDDDELTIYDNNLGPEYGTDIAFLDKTNPNINFGIGGKRVTKGLYAFMPRGGSFYATWED